MTQLCYFDSMTSHPHPARERILVVDDHPFVANLISEILTNAGFTHVDVTHDLETAAKKIDMTNYNLVLVDHFLGQGSGLDLLSYVLAKRPQLPVILMVEGGNVELAVDMMRQGSFDVLEKPIHPEKLIYCVERALEFRFYKSEIIRLAPDENIEDIYHGMVGRSEPMKKVFSLIERIKASSVNILITGPSGAGKEMIAKALHDTSPRAGKKFVAINCSAIPDALLEGELFGYKKGAFTDARTDKLGLFQEAEGGTIFLDEIGDMPLTVQPKILRALQEKEVRPLGSIQSIKVDVRIIAATNQELQERIAQKLFREDLYYRLNAMQIELPSLKERPEDIPLLVDYFMDKTCKKHGHPIKGISHSAMKKLLDYSWPGNVRELENVVERAILLARGDSIMPEDLSFSKDESGIEGLTAWAKRKRPLEDVEKDYILEVLRNVDGNRSEAAEVLGIGRKTLYNKLARYGL